MNLYKFYFIVNIGLLIVETITIYLYNEKILWLIVMLSSIFVQITSVIAAKEHKNVKE